MAVAVAVALAVPATAGAAVQIGSNLNGGDEPISVNAATDPVAVATVESTPARTTPAGLKSPIDGVITEWRSGSGGTWRRSISSS